MRDVELFERALGLMWPWRVERTEFDAKARRLDLYLDFERGGTFACPECGGGECTAHDTRERSWRHLDFFQHQAFLHARVPRVSCPACGVKQVQVPWARPGSGFTVLFEALVMQLAKEMPVKAVGRLIGENDTRVWRMLKHHVGEARQAADYSDVRCVGMDETACRRGHDYITLFADLERSRLMYATEGRAAGVVKAFGKDLKAHGGEAGQIEELCMDMLPAYMKGAREQFPKASVTFDRFHVLKLLNTAIDEVRRSERKARPELTRSRYLWLKNPARLTVGQRAWIEEQLVPSRLGLKTARAYRIKLAFQEFWSLPPALAEGYLKRWYFWATHSRLPPVIKAARTIKENWAGIIRWFRSRISNGMLEAMNSLVQAAKARARGYRTTENFITIAYLVCGKLDFSLPT